MANKKDFIVKGGIVVNEQTKIGTDDDGNIEFKSFGTGVEELRNIMIAEMMFNDAFGNEKKFAIDNATGQLKSMNVSRNDNKEITATVEEPLYLGANSTNHLAEGGDNLYYTDARARNALSASGNINYNKTTGRFTFTMPDTDDIGEGSTNLYYTDARVDARFSAKSTSDLSEGTNLYYTDARVQSVIDTNSAGFITEYTVTESDVTGHQGAIRITESQISNLDKYTNADVDAKLAAGVGNIVTTGYIRGPATLTIDPAAHGDNTGKVVIAGDLQVDGTTTTINSTTVSIDDLNIVLAENASDASEANGAGITINGADATIKYTSGSDTFDFNKGIEVTGDINGSGNFDFNGTSSHLPGHYYHNSYSNDNIYIHLYNNKSDTVGNTYFRFKSGASFTALWHDVSSQELRYDNTFVADSIKASSDFSLNGTTAINSSRDFYARRSYVEDFIDIEGNAYFRDDLYVLNSAGTGWVRFVNRNGGSPIGIFDGGVNTSNSINIERTSNGNSIRTSTNGVINFQVENYSTQTTIRTDTNDFYIWQPGSSYQLRVQNNGGVHLAYDGSMKLSTTSDGVVIGGHLNASDSITVNANNSGNNYLYLNKPTGGDGHIIFRENQGNKWQNTSIGNDLHWYSYAAGEYVGIWSGTGSFSPKHLNLYDINGSEQSYWSMYGWDNEFQLTTRDSRFGAHTGTPFSINYDNHVTTLRSEWDVQLILDGSNTTWAGIKFQDVGGSDSIFFNGATKTWSMGGGGAPVAGKKLHIDGGTTIGSTADGIVPPVDGLYVQGTIKIGTTHKGNFGDATFSWGGSSGYPTLYSDHQDRWIMICAPHIPYLKSGVRGYAGTTAGATVLHEKENGGYWAAGAHPDAPNNWSIRDGQGGTYFSIDTAAVVTLNGRSADWGQRVQGSSKGSLHIKPGTSFDNFGGAITWGSSDNAYGEEADAGIYVRSDGNYGTRMYISTTDSYSQGAKTAIEINENGQVTLPRNNLMLSQEIRFSVAAESNYSNYIRAYGFPSQGYNASTQRYWIEYGAQGGHHFVVNTDGGVGASENDYDDFTIWQGEVDGDRLLSVSNTGNTFIKGGLQVLDKLEVGDTNGAPNTSIVSDLGKYVEIGVPDSISAAPSASGVVFHHGGVATSALKHTYETSGQTKFKFQSDRVTTVEVAGDLTVTGQITESSSIRYKENVSTITGSLDKVNSLRGVYYNKIDTPEQSEVGLIAEEVAEVMPELVTYNEDVVEGVKYSKTVALLVEAIKELTARVEELESGKN